MCMWTTTGFFLIGLIPGTGSSSSTVGVPAAPICQKFTTQCTVVATQSGDCSAISGIQDSSSEATSSDLFPNMIPGILALWQSFMHYTNPIRLLRTAEDSDLNAFQDWHSLQDWKALNAR